MSSLAVRQALQTELENYLTAAGISFIETVNDVPVSKPSTTWATVKFSAYGNENFCYAAGKGRETGVADVMVYVRPGRGYTVAVGIADGLATHFNGFDNGAGVVVVNVVPANEATAGDDSGGWYGVLLGLEYQYYY